MKAETMESVVLATTLMCSLSYLNNLPQNVKNSYNVRVSVGGSFSKKMQNSTFSKSI